MRLLSAVLGMECTVCAVLLRLENGINTRILSGLRSVLRERKIP